MTDTQALAEFGKKICDVPGYTDCWVKFKTAGYPRKLRREWDAGDAEARWLTVLRYVDAWKLKDIAGADVPLGADTGNVEDAVYIWIIRTFVDFWLVELTAPRPNS